MKTFKLIIAGSRTLKFSTSFVNEIITNTNLIPEEAEAMEVVSGGANGIDKCGESWAKEFDCEIRRFLPDYEKFIGSVAPKKRNTQMAEYADALLLIWDGSSRGSLDMKTKMQQQGKPVYEVIVRNNK